MKDFDVPEEIRHDLRCIDARGYARKLRRNGGHPEAVISVIKGIWGEKVAEHVKSLEDNRYYLSKP